MEDENKSAFRVVVIGKESVGKTSIVTRLIQNRFNPYEPGTIGANYQVYHETVENETVDMQIWDTAGQEKFKSLTPVYCRNAAAAVIVFSLTNRASFDELNKQIEEFIDTAGDKAVIFIAANKSDMADDFDVSFEEAKQYAADTKFRVFLTSAKSGEGIKQLFSELARELYAKNQNRFMQEPKLELEGDQQKENCKC